MGNRRSNVVVARGSKPKTTKMNERAKKPANKTGKGQMVYSKGKH